MTGKLMIQPNFSIPKEWFPSYAEALCLISLTSDKVC